MISDYQEVLIALIAILAVTALMAAAGARSRPRSSKKPLKSPQQPAVPLDRIAPYHPENAPVRFGARSPRDIHLN